MYVQYATFTHPRHAGMVAARVRLDYIQASSSRMPWLAPAAPGLWAFPSSTIVGSASPASTMRLSSRPRITYQ